MQNSPSSFRDLPLTRELSDSVEEWFAFLENASKACGCGGVGESTSRDRLSSFLAGTALLNALTLLDAADAAVFILLPGRDVSAHHGGCRLESPADLEDHLAEVARSDTLRDDRAKIADRHRGGDD